MTNSVTIRPIAITVPDLETVAHIKHVCFGTDEAQALADLKDYPRYNLSHTIVAELEGRVVGTATMFPAKLWLSGVPLDIGAIAAVGVLPEFREQGITRQLIEHFIQQAAQENFAMTFLFPSSHQLYQKFGFGAVSDLHAYCIAPSNLVDFPEKEKVRNFEADDLAMMRVMYKGQMTWHNGWFSRSNEWWDRIIKDWPNIVVFDNDDMIDGYLAYDLYVNDQGQQVLHVREFFAAEGVAFRGLIGFLANQQTVEVIEYLAPADSPLRHCLIQPRAQGSHNRGWIFHDLCHVTVGPMARIITLKTALTKRFYARHMQGDRIIKLNDPLLPNNEALVVFRLVDGRAECNPAPDNAEPDIEAEVGTFTQILCGYLSAADAQRLGRLKADDDTCSWLDKAIADSPLFVQAGDWF